jgi:hypothetical protein
MVVRDKIVGVCIQVVHCVMYEGHTVAKLDLYARAHAPPPGTMTQAELTAPGGYEEILGLTPFYMDVEDEDMCRTYVDALHDMIARRKPPGVRCPSPTVIVIQPPKGGDTVAVHLK